jgi:mono/diheme cytochrome c family protein
MEMLKADKLLLFFSVVIATSFAVTLRSFGQDPSSSTNKNQTETRQVGGSQQPAPPTAQQDFSKNTWELPADADRTKNPIATTEESVAKGKDLYMAKAKGNCVFCHGETGAGNTENLPKLRRKPADLSNKERLTAMSDGEIFWKITKGINGIMPAGEKRMTEEERWHVVNFVRTLGKEPAINEEQ